MCIPRFAIYDVWVIRINVLCLTLMGFLVVRIRGLLICLRIIIKWFKIINKAKINLIIKEISMNEGKFPNEWRVIMNYVATLGVQKSSHRCTSVTLWNICPIKKWLTCIWLTDMLSINYILLVNFACWCFMFVGARKLNSFESFGIPEKVFVFGDSV